MEKKGEVEAAKSTTGLDGRTRQKMQRISRRRKVPAYGGDLKVYPPRERPARPHPESTVQNLIGELNGRRPWEPVTQRPTTSGGRGSPGQKAVTSTVLVQAQIRQGGAQQRMVPGSGPVKTRKETATKSVAAERRWQKRLARSDDCGREAWSCSTTTEAMLRLVHLHDFEQV